MLTDGTDHDDADARILVECFEGQAKLVALPHRHDVVRRPIENDVGALMRFVNLDTETVELGETRIGELVSDSHSVFPVSVVTIVWQDGPALRCILRQPVDAAEVCRWVILALPRRTRSGVAA